MNERHIQKMYIRIVRERERERECSMGQIRLGQVYQLFHNKRTWASNNSCKIHGLGLASEQMWPAQPTYTFASRM